jgi:predicted hydrolase (HD superfamily)
MFSFSVNTRTISGWEKIMECEKLNMPLNEFLDLSLDAMKGVADEIGL